MLSNSKYADPSMQPHDNNYDEALRANYEQFLSEVGKSLVRHLIMGRF